MRYKYLIKYLITGDFGKKTESKEIEFTKPKTDWSLKDYSRLEEYIKSLYKTHTDVTIIETEALA